VGRSLGFGARPHPGSTARLTGPIRGRPRLVSARCRERPRRRINPLYNGAQRCYNVVTDYRYYKGGGIYVRKVTSRGGGPYFQLVRSYRNEEGQPRQEVLVHLGVHETPEAALSAWPGEVAHLRRIGRDRQADKLEANLKKLRAKVDSKQR
jgi:hypothetical protein